MSDKKELKNIYEAIAYVMKEVEAIGKDSQNKQQGFKFRGIDAVYNSMHDLMSKAEIVMLPEVLERHRDERQSKAGSLLFYTILRIKYNFIHSSGSSVSCVVEGEGMDSGDKSVAKAMSIAQKYALFQTFLIPTEASVDPDAESYEVVDKKTIPLVFGKDIMDCETIEDWADRFIKNTKIDQPEDMLKQFVADNMATGRKIYAQLKSAKNPMADELAKIFTRFK